MRVLWTLGIAALVSCGEFYEVSPDRPPDALPDGPPHGSDALADAPVLVGSDVVLFFQMNSVGASATCVIDSSSGHHDGSCDASPPTLVSDGVAGSAYHFQSNHDATDSRGFTLAPTGDLADLPEYTVSVWLRMEPPLVSDYECVVNRIYDHMQGDAWQICLGPQPNGITVFSNQLETVGSDLGSDFSWKLYHHIALTYGNTGHALYVDGAFIASAAGIEVAGVEDLISIGRDLDPPNGSASAPSNSDLVPNAGYQGDMDELRIYNRVLSAQEIMDLVQHPSGS